MYGMGVLLKGGFQAIWTRERSLVQHYKKADVLDMVLVKFVLNKKKGKMKIRSAFVKLFIYCFFVMSLNGCTHVAHVPSSDVAMRFIKALNNNEVQVLADMVTLPFYVYDQQWESAKDGYGHVLGKKEQIILKNRKNLSAYVTVLSDKLKVESMTGEFIPVTDYLRFHKELGSSTSWKQQDVFLFVRGMEDVEHIVLLGVNRELKKVEQIYFN